MSDVMEIVQNEDGTFSAYDDTYDIVIHCETEAEQKKAIDLMNSNRWIPVDERLSRPDWCPLKLLPEKMTGVASTDHWDRIKAGWNGCINKITGGNYDD